MDRILIIGAAGQIGSELILALRKIYGNENVFAADIRDVPPEVQESGPFVRLDVMDDKHLIHFIIRHKITQIYHLAAVLSGNAEKLPTQAWQINMSSLMNILEVAKMVDDVKKVFWPSSIAVFGPTTPRIDTPQLTIMEPTTVYGISKLAGERWCEYYFKKYGVDVRSLRYPGLISHKTEPGGGTTDWAVEIYYEAIKNRHYRSFLKLDTCQPLMYMSDAIEATIALMEVPREEVTIHSAYNLSAFSASPEEIAMEIKKTIPEFTIMAKPDYRQEIAESWPESINDSLARNKKHWSPKFDLSKTTGLMLAELKKRLK